MAAARAILRYKRIPRNSGEFFHNWKTYYNQALAARVFPAHAGMNRPGAITPHSLPSVPRARGDEPEALLAKNREYQCSPRTRG